MILLAKNWLLTVYTITGAVQIILLMISCVIICYRNISFWTKLSWIATIFILPLIGPILFFTYLFFDKPTNKNLNGGK